MFNQNKDNDSLEAPVRFKLEALTLRGIGSYINGQRLEFKPLTVLCGPNGSGKSTWIKVLRMLKRSAESPAFPFALDSTDFPNYYNQAASDLGRNVRSVESKDGAVFGSKIDFIPELFQDNDFGPMGTIGIEFRAREEIDRHLLGRTRTSRLKVIFDKNKINSHLEKELRAFKDLYLFGYYSSNHYKEGTRFRLRIGLPPKSCSSAHGNLLQQVELSIDGKPMLAFRGAFDELEMYPLRALPMSLYLSAEHPIFQGKKIEESPQYPGMVAIASFRKFKEDAFQVTETFREVVRECNHQYDVHYYFINSLMEMFSNEVGRIVQELFAGFYAIGPIRSVESRETLSDIDLYPFRKNIYVGYQGENSWQVYLNHFKTPTLGMSSPEISDMTLAPWLHRDELDDAGKENALNKDVSLNLAMSPGTKLVLDHFRQASSTEWKFFKSKLTKINELLANLKEQQGTNEKSWQQYSEERTKLQSKKFGILTNLWASILKLDQKTEFISEMIGQLDLAARSLYATLVRSFSSANQHSELNKNLNAKLLLFCESATLKNSTKERSFIDRDIMPILAVSSVEEDLSRWLEYLEIGKLRYDVLDRLYEDYRIKRHRSFQKCSFLNSMFLEFELLDRRIRGRSVDDIASPIGQLKSINHPCFGAVLSEDSEAHESSARVAPSWLSSGFHQVFPILLQVSLAKPFEIIAVENPEVHLHADCVRKLTEFLIANAVCNRIILVETHSDLFIRRVLRAILTEEIAQSQVGVNAVELRSGFSIGKRSGSVTEGDWERMTKGEYVFAESKLEPIQLDEMGRVKNWPKGFLDVDDDEAERTIEAMSHFPLISDDADLWPEDGEASEDEEGEN